MCNTLGTALAAAAVLVLTVPPHQAAAMPPTSSAAIGAAAKASGAATPVRYRRHHDYWAPHDGWAWRAAYGYPRHYWYAAPLPNPHYDILDPYWGDFWYDPGRYWGWGGHDSPHM